MRLLPSRIVETVAPPRLGSSFRWLLSASVVNNVGDSVTLLARTFGITAPFWFGFVGSALLVVVLWRQFEHIVHSGDERERSPVRTAGPDLS